MTVSRDVLALFNRGIVSKLGLARIDVSRISLSAAQQTNWMPRVLGSMSLRPGLEYLGELVDDDNPAVVIPFVYDRDDKSLLELSPGVMRVRLDDDSLITRAAVSTTVSNGLFTTDLTDWTDADEGAAASSHNASGYLQLLGTGAEAARRRQTLTVAPADQSVVHALRIVVVRGPAVLRIGTSAGDDDVFRQASLRTGVHSIAFTPGAGTIYVELSTTVRYPVLVDSCTMEGAGVLELPTPWDTEQRCLDVRWQRSNDVVFCACTGLQQRRIERRPNGSWSVVLYQSSDGPFEIQNTSRLTLTPSAITGSITLTANQPLFRTGHVGAKFRLSSQGQIVDRDISAENTFTNSIRVTGVGATRAFSVVRAGTWSATVTLQRSIDDGASWTDVTTYTGNGSVSYNDALDNSIALYRIGIKTGDYTSGTAELTLDYGNGSITGLVEVTAYTSATEVSAIVLEDLGGTDATDLWSEGAWSDQLGWPDAVTIYEGRLGWSGRGRNWMSVSDAFDNFDPDVEGDSAPINREVGVGATNRTNWMLPLQRLIAGTDDGEHSVRSTSFDEPVTRANYNSKRIGSRGSSPAPAMLVDARGYYVGRNKQALYELAWSSERLDYLPRRTTVLAPELFEQGIRRIAVQTEPDERVHCVMEDGTACVLVRDDVENVEAWVTLTTDGEFEDVAVMPGASDDEVYYVVKRVINGSTKRYLERMAPEQSCRGGTLNLQADSYVTGTNTPASTALTGLDHLEGETVVIWADGADQGTAVVSSGTVTLATAVSSWVAGLGYDAVFKSAKLAASLQDGPSLTQRSRINKIGLLLADTHSKGLLYGPSADILDELPDIEDGAAVATGAVWDAYDEDMIEFPGDWDTDNRLYLKASAPRPCTVLAAVLNIDRQRAG
jgi:hypothetical protein